MNHVKKSSIIAELAELSKDHTTAHTVMDMICCMGVPVPEALLTGFKHLLQENRRLTETVTKFQVCGIPPLIVKFPGTVEEFEVMLKNAKGDHHAR